MDQFDLVVIGAGPGGYVAAVEAAKQGLRTAVVERRDLGGTCLNRGCIPSRILLHAAYLLRMSKQFPAQGLTPVTDAALDPVALKAWRDDVVPKLQAGIAQLFKMHKVTRYDGHGTLVAPDRVTVTEADGTVRDLQAKFVLLATGAVNIVPDNIPGGELALTSDDLLEHLDVVYPRLLISGGGVTGVEFAAAYIDLGCQVTMISSCTLRHMDRELSRSMQALLKKRGVDYHEEARLRSIEKTETGLRCICMDKKTGERFECEADAVLMAAAPRSDTTNLFGPGVSVEMNGYDIKVDEHWRTSLPGVYAIGDVTGGLRLAHVASAAGKCAVAHMLGKPDPIDMGVVPGCVYTYPQIATVGLTADAAREAGYTVRTRKLPMTANGQALVTREERSFVKVVEEAETGRILGAQLFCAQASEMIGELSLAIARGLTVKDLSRVIHPHPTYNEILGDLFSL